MLATGGSGSRFAVCAENAYAVHAGPHDYTGVGLRVAEIGVATKVRMLVDQLLEAVFR